MSAIIKNKREAFATAVGMDFSETEDYRYHYGRTNQPVWAVGDTYYCVTKGPRKPAKLNGEDHWDWIEVKEPIINQHGFNLYQSK